MVTLSTHLVWKAMDSRAARQTCSLEVNCVSPHRIPRASGLQYGYKHTNISIDLVQVV